MKNLKRVLAFVLSCVIALSLFGCGSKGEGAEKKAAGDRVVIYTAAEDERIAYLQNEMNARFPEADIIFQSLGTGEMLSKLQAEGESTSCDIFYDLEVINAEIILAANPNLFADLSEYDFSIYDPSVTGYTSRHHQYAPNGKTYGAFLVNTKMLKEAGKDIPASYSDILDAQYADLVAMPSPKSSGTGYSLYNGMITVLGEKEGMAYFDALNSNIKEYTTSGSAPVKAVDRGDVAIGFGLLWQCVNFANANENLEVLIPDGKLPFGLFTMGMISGHEKNETVKKVFDYLYNDLNKTQVAKFNPDKIYVDQLPAEISNYPNGFAEIAMANLFDHEYKQALLDKWVY